MKFGKYPLALEQNVYETKILNAYIVHELIARPKTPNNFKLKICLFCVTNRVKNGDKEWVCSGYGIAFDGSGSWNFDNDLSRNVIVFYVENILSSHNNNRKNNFLTLGEGPTYCISRSFGLPEKKCSINFSKINRKICLSLYYSHNDNYLFFNGKEIVKFKSDT